MIDGGLVAGFVIGFLTAGTIGRVKFLQVQNKLRNVGNWYEDKLNTISNKLVREERLNEGLTQELDAVAQKSRITTTS